MTPPEFEFELHCIKIHPINHYSVLPLSRLFGSEAKSLTLPCTGLSSLMWAPHIIFLSSSTACSQANRDTFSHAPSGDSNSTFLFSLFHSFLYYLSHVYHYGSYTLAVEKHTGRINIFFRYIFIICWSSNYLFYINSEDILNYDLKPVRTAPQFWITERKKKKNSTLFLSLLLYFYLCMPIYLYFAIKLIEFKSNTGSQWMFP